jgi:hypothetical protein
MSSRSNRLSRLLALSACAALAATGLVLGTPALASAVGPSGGPTIAVHCNKYTGGQDSIVVTDNFSGLVTANNTAYRVVFTYYSDYLQATNTFYDEDYWYPDPDGSYNHVYTLRDQEPTVGESYTWQLESINGVITPNILTGSGGVGGPGCVKHTPKPAKPEIASTTLKVSKAGRFDVRLAVDANVTGTVHVAHSGANLASAIYSSHSKTSVVVKLVVGKAALKHLEKVGTEAVKITATAKNSGGQVSAAVSGKLKAPKKKK